MVDKIFDWNSDFPLDFGDAAYFPLQPLFEGVVCKGTHKTKGRDLIWQVKCKTRSWLEAVRALKGQKYLLEEVNGDTELAAV